MGNNFNTPAEVVEANIASGKVKANLTLGKMILLGILAGIFIAIGGEASSLASHDIANVGLARTITGAIFPVGLMMIVLVGGELFTGNTMIVMAVMDKQATWLQYVRNLVVVWLSNLVGSLIIVVITFFSGQWNYTSGALGAYTIKIAYGKCNLDFGTAFSSGILCNILVCVAVLMAIAAKDIAGKIWGIFFPIFAFVISGFEHCVANMYYIPAGLIAMANPNYVAKAEELYGLTADKLQSLSVGGMVQNMIPVTLGNIVGGAVFVGALLYVINKKCGKKTAK
ncbi:MAG: formate/nitrite transporter family protein [Lachnospiraceae bacterium]|nr:formate/nitrite transporter family protein [Candidatus Merdinaster equi]